MSAKRDGKKPIEMPRRGVGRNPTLIPGNPGNSGGKKGRSGRKTLAFKAELEAMRDDEIPKKLRDMLKKANPEDPAWRWAAERVLEYTTSKAPSKQEIGGDGEQPIRFKLDLASASLARLHE